MAWRSARTGGGRSPPLYDQTLKLWDLEMGRELRTLTGHSDWVKGTAGVGTGGLRSPLLWTGR
ncbi:MAG TPA: hypothetical protein VKM93_10645 [Terriglobia bacterium]|nr:hypothetical protein [Terriglobia bacterium]